MLRRILRRLREYLANEPRRHHVPNVPIREGPIRVRLDDLDDDQLTASAFFSLTDGVARTKDGRGWSCCYGPVR